MNGYESGEQVLEAYIRGSRTLDADLLRGCFHPSATMNGYLKGQLVLGDPEPFLADIAAMKVRGVRHDTFAGEVVAWQVEADVAAAEVRMDNLGDALNFRDFLHLIRQDERWSILSKTFTSL